MNCFSTGRGISSTYHSLCWCHLQLIWIGPRHSYSLWIGGLRLSPFLYVWLTMLLAIIIIAHWRRIFIKMSSSNNSISIIICNNNIIRRLLWAIIFISITTIIRSCSSSNCLNKSILKITINKVNKVNKVSTSHMTISIIIMQHFQKWIKSTITNIITVKTNIITVKMRSWHIWTLMSMMRWGIIILLI